MTPTRTSVLHPPGKGEETVRQTTGRKVGSKAVKEIDAKALDAIVRNVQAAQKAALTAEALVNHPDAGMTAQAARYAADAGEACVQALQCLQSLGASIPLISSNPAPTGSDLLPLHLLDTPKSRGLLAALEIAAHLAAEVDRERGRIDENGAPTGIGETLAGMVAGLQVEINGPKGRE